MDKSSISFKKISTSDFEKKNSSSQKSDNSSCWLKTLSQRVEMDPFLHVYIIIYNYRKHIKDLK